MGFIRNKKNIKYWPGISLHAPFQKRDSHMLVCHFFLPGEINKHKIFLNVSNSLTAPQQLRRNTEVDTEVTDFQEDAGDMYPPQYESRRGLLFWLLFIYNIFEKSRRLNLVFLVIKKYLLKVRKRGELMIQDYLLTSRAMPTAEQSAAITHAEPEPKAGVHQDHHTRFLPDDVYASP